jgi:hypothetical protein
MSTSTWKRECGVPCLKRPGRKGMSSVSASCGYSCVRELSGVKPAAGTRIGLRVGKERSDRMRQNKRFRKMLRQLEGMVVWVHEVAKEAEKEGLSRQHLQDAAVIRLLDSGIKALGIGNVPEPPGNPWLNIFINTVRNGGTHFFSVTVRLDETVRPERTKSLRTVGTTWEVSAVGAVDGKRVAQKIEEVLDSLLEDFIYDYTTENIP